MAAWPLFFCLVLNWASWDFVGGFWGFRCWFLVGRVFMATGGGFFRLAAGLPLPPPEGGGERSILPLRLFRGAGLSLPFGLRRHRV